MLPVPASAQSLETDSLALVALYNTAGGNNWTNKTNWLTGPVDTWAGVTVSGGRVTRLILVQNQLTGPIPPELGNLTNLSLLILVANQLTGPIPPEFGNLASLSNLDLTRNQIGGQIPPELGNPANLIEVRLGENQLTGPIPPELGDLTNLVELSLQRNLLTGPIPPELGNLANLRQLNVNENQLTSLIPAQLGNLAALTKLVVSDNDLSGHVPSEIGNLVNLTLLDISGNSRLSNALPRSLTNLTVLQTFHFGGTGVCSPSDIEFRTWLDGIGDLDETTICPFIVTNGTLEERVELSWDISIPGNSLFSVERGGTGIAILASSVREYADVTAVPGVVYEYCLIENKADATEGPPVCALGSRKIFAPTSFAATDGIFEDYVQLTWTDRSQIESGYVLSRSGGTPIDPINVNANTAFYQDKLAEPGVTYAYTLLAYVDVDKDGAYTPGTDFVSESKTDDGFRGFVMPPAQVDATDGQFTDRVRITWLDRSTIEDEFRIYRDSVEIATVIDPDPATSETLTYDDSTAVAGQIYQYCVASVTGAVESVQVCDNGRRGALSPPQDVVASVDVFDDRVQVTWTDATDTEDGFEVFRDSVRIDSLGANGQTYNDFTAAQGVDYTYCVQAFSTADPAAVSYSSQRCTAGRRAHVLAPAAVSASDGTFEDRVDISWDNESTTVMVFNVYRVDPITKDSLVIASVEPGVDAYGDNEIGSGQEHAYCVSSLTISGASAQTQAQVAQWLSADAVAELSYQAAEPSGVDAQVLPGTLLQRVLAEQGEAGTASIVESKKVCDDGRRVIAMPSSVAATFDAFENRTEITWENNSNVATRINIYRSDAGVTEHLDSVSTTRTSFGDYTGVPGIQYTYSVGAADALGESQRVSDLGRRSLKAPTGLRASDGTSESLVELTWIDNSRAETGYRIYRSSAGSDTTKIGTTEKGAISFTNDLTTPLPDPQNGGLGIQYTYHVVAFDTLGESASGSDDGSTFILAPADVNASDNYTDRVVVAWIDVSGLETGYVITRSDGLVDVTVPADSTTYTDTTALAGQTYTYCVATTGGAIATSAPVCDEGGVPDGSAPLDFSAADLQELLEPLTSVRRFGTGISVDGDYAIIGSDDDDNGVNSGAAYIFTRGGTTWTERQKLTANDASAQDLFGSRGNVAIDGDYAIIGASGDDDNGSSSGAAYVFKRDGTTWTEQQKLTASDGALNASFGSSVSIDGDYAIIGAAGDDDNGSLSGAAYVFKRDGTTWTEQQKLTASDGAPDASFGSSVSIDGDYAIIGAPRQGQGAAYIFRRDGTTWTELSKLTDPDPIPEDDFGRAVSIDGDYAIIGDNAEIGEVGPFPAGSAFIYRRDGTNWTLQQKLTHNDAFGGDHFGFAVSIDGDYAIIGARQDNDNGAFSGSAYLFRNEEGVWRQIQKILPGTVSGNADDNVGASFGSGVALREGNVIIGAPGFLDNTGIAYGAQVLVKPTLVTASDGGFPDRIQIRWTDNSLYEGGYRVYRREARGELKPIDVTDVDATSYNDFSAAAGTTYEYCVVAFNSRLKDDFSDAMGESLPVCDIGWRPANGVISGRVATAAGGGTEDVDVCLDPSPNRGLLFDGSGGVVTIAGLQGANMALPADHLEIVQGFTIEFWAKRALVGSNDYIVTHGQEADADSALYVGFRSSDAFTFTFEGDPLDTGSTYTDTDWHHWVVTYDHATKDRTIYRDTIQVASSNAAAAYSGTGVLYVGSWFGASGSPNNFGGQLDELRIWNTVRTASEIAENYDRRLTGEEEDLYGYWPFDEGALGVTANLTGGVHNGLLSGGVHWTSMGAFDICAETDLEGNYSLAGLRYGGSTEFKLTPSRENRVFEPTFKLITLSTESPVQNEVGFSDVTALNIAGVVQYVDSDSTGNVLGTCPVPSVEIYADDVLKATSEADGSYIVAVDPSNVNAHKGDKRKIEPRYTNPQNARDIHTFDPPLYEESVTTNLTGRNFEDLTRHTLSGYFGGNCEIPIGSAKLRIFTEDGCFDREFAVSSDSSFSIALPPLRYLVRVEDIVSDSPLRADIIQFFDNLGAVEVDLTNDDVERDFVYHAPLAIVVDGFSKPQTCNDNVIVEKDGDDILRTLDLSTIDGLVGKGEEVPLMISVNEDFGNDGLCPVDGGTLRIFDAIADRADADLVVTIEEGAFEYTTQGVSPNVFAGAMVDGIDRSFQKSLTVIAEVEGLDPLTKTAWAIVEGSEPRTATFTSAVTEEIPMLVLHDPPGDASYAYLEQGTTKCTRLSNLKIFDNTGGEESNVEIGFKSDVGATVFGAFFSTENKAAIKFVTRIVGGKEVTETGGRPNWEICTETADRFSTSGEDTFIGRSADIYVGAAFNLIFALSDNLFLRPTGLATLEPTTITECAVFLTESLALDLDQNKPFETTYIYTEDHIANTVIPQHMKLIDEQRAGDTQVGPVPLRRSLENWKKHLETNKTNITKGLKNLSGDRYGGANVSFSAGADFEHSTGADTVNTTTLTTRIYTENDFALGPKSGAAGNDSEILVIFEHSEHWIEAHDTATDTSTTIGYVLSDDDRGDFFTLDVGEDPVHKTPVFGLKSGTSSNPWEPGPEWKPGDPVTEALTQPRDLPKLSINPPVQPAANPNAPATFTLTLSNDSQSREDREYVLRTVHTSNPGGAVLRAQGASIQNGLSFFIGGGQSQEVTLEVFRGPNRYHYKDLAVMLYAPGEYAIWENGGTNQLADTVRFSVDFEAPCSDIEILRPKNPWTYNSTDGNAGPLELIGSGLTLNSDDLDVQAFGLYYRQAGTPDYNPVQGAQYEFEPVSDEYPDGRFKNTNDPVDILTPQTTFFSVNWDIAGAGVPDGGYELRGQTECGARKAEDKVFSDLVVGTIDRTAPVVFGTPQPSNGILSFGGDVSVTFNEPIACGSIVTEGADKNIVLLEVATGTPIGVEAVCNGETIIVRPSAAVGRVWDPWENGLLRVELIGLGDASGVVPVSDVLGNPLERPSTGDAGVPENVHWEFTVQRTAFAWLPGSILIDEGNYGADNFSAKLVNGRAQAVDFTLADGPAWLTPSVTQGTVPPGGTRAVQFAIDRSMTLTDTTIAARTDKGDALLYLQLGCAIPEWTVDPASFQYSMSLTGELFLDGLPSDDADDLVAAFVGSQLRGVASVEPAGGRNRVNVTIYSNDRGGTVDRRGETVTLLVFDASECLTYPGTTESFEFKNGAVIGTQDQPVSIDPTFDLQQQQIALAAGWTWFSLNREPFSTALGSVLSTVSPAAGDLVKSSTAFSLYDSNAGWVGALAAINTGEAYLARLSAGGTMVVGGDTVDSKTPIDVKAGWTWIGYLPQGSRLVPDALRSLSPTVNDQIKSQYAFAQWDGSTWIGSLTQMDPGLGYMIRMANADVLVYPSAPAAAARPISPSNPNVYTDIPTRLANAGGAMSKRAEGEGADDTTGELLKNRGNGMSGDDMGLLRLPDFQRSAFNMTVTAEVQIDDQPANRPVFVGAFVGEEPRGLAQATYVESLDSYRVFLMVYSNEPEGETVTFRILDDETDRFYDLNQTAPFDADAILGTPGEPVVLDNRASGKLKTAEELPTQFALRQNYPNPFNPTTTIKYDVPSQSDVRIVLYDVLGREVRRLVDGNQKAGRYEVVFDASQIASGAYFYRMQAGDFQALHKMIVLK